MDKKKARLFDATKRMVEAGTAENEIIKSLQDIGVATNDALELLEKAKGSSPPAGSGFWESEGKFFGEKPDGKANAGAFGSPAETVDSPEGKRQIGDWAINPSAKGKHGAMHKKIGFREILPVRVSKFDQLIERGGLKRGDTIMLSGGCGTGKTTFSMQSLYNGALNNEKGVYLTLEESADKMRENMMQNFGWNLEDLEREEKMAIVKIDPLTIARAVEATLTKERGGLYIEFEEFELPFQLNLPFKPDRVVVDSLSALSIAFMENEQAYRMYLRHLFETLEKYNSCNIVLGETEQEPGIYSRSGIEEFLADGVVVFYNIKIHNIREKALEILKLRSSNHEKKITPYKITSNGFEIYPGQELFRED